MKSRGLVIKKLNAHKLARIPAGWAIRDVVTGFFRGSDADNVLYELKHARAWVRSRIGAWRAKSRKEAVKEANRYPVREAEGMSDREFDFWNGLDARLRERFGTLGRPNIKE